MPRGRMFYPSPQKDGIWFAHRDCDDGRPLERQKSTMTGRMLCAPFRPETNNYPPDPPVPFRERGATTYKFSNRFSTLDSKDALASDGETFGTPAIPRRVGRRLAPDVEHDMHRSERDLLTHYGRHLSLYDYNTIYSDNYRGCLTSQPTTCCRKYQRQYPEARHCLAPESVGCLPPAASSAPDGSDPPPMPRCRATTELLAITQKPFLKEAAKPGGETWKYSYRGLPRCYPGGYAKLDATNPYPGFFYRRLTPTQSSCDVRSG